MTFCHKAIIVIHFSTGQTVRIDSNGGDHQIVSEASALRGEVYSLSEWRFSNCQRHDVLHVQNSDQFRAAIPWQLPLSSANINSAAFY